MKAPQPPLEPGPEAATAPEAERARPPRPEPWTPERVVGLERLLRHLRRARGVAPGLPDLGRQGRHLLDLVRLPRAGRDPEARAAARRHLSFTTEGSRWVDLSPGCIRRRSRCCMASAGRSSGRTPPGRPGGRDRGGRGECGGAHADAPGAAGDASQGPGLWWVAVCAAAGPLVGRPGVPRVGDVGAAPPGDRTPALAQGDRPRGWARSASALVPLFALWANVDASFLIGLIVLAARLAVAGGGPQGTAGPFMGRSAGRGRRGLVGFLACAAACLVNPSHALAFPEAAVGVDGRFAIPFGSWPRRGPSPRMSRAPWAILRLAAGDGGLGALLLLDQSGATLARQAPVFRVGGPAGVLHLGRDAGRVRPGAGRDGGDERAGMVSRPIRAVGRVGKGWAAWSVGGGPVTIAATTSSPSRLR